MRKNDEPNYTFFWHEYEENGVFSNWYECKIEIDDVEYFCVEQYMMSQKAKLFGDTYIYDRIMHAHSPMGCKRLGAKVTPFDRYQWSKVSFDVVKKGNKAKFEQHPELIKALLATGDSIMAEASPKDAIWGIGIDAAAAARTPMAQWPGRNQLGKVLMELRDEFRNK